MQGYGPITITVGTVTQQTVDPSADRVLISNRSIYDCLVSFSNTHPLASTICSPQWPVFVHAGDQVVYTLQKRDKSPTPLLLGVGQYWSGNVWICPIGRQTGLASNGTISASNQVFVMALAPGDETPTLAARPTNVDASSQQRVVSVPMTPNPLVSNGVITNFNTGYQAELFHISFTSTQTINFYFFGAMFTTADSYLLTPQIGLLQEDDNGLAVGAAVWIRTYWLQAPCICADYPAYPPIWNVSQNIAGGATQLAILVHNNFASVTGKAVTWSIFWQADTTNLQPVPGIGVTPYAPFGPTGGIY